MSISARSFAKINIGLCIGARRHDGFHELRTIYQTVALHDRVRVDVGRGTGIEVRCKDPRVPADEANSCYRMAERVLRALKVRGRIVVQIEKKLPVQGGLGAASSNAVATMLALERLLKQQLTPEQRLSLAAEIGSDLPLFLIGGTVLGVDRGAEVFPMPDLPPLDCVIATPEVGVSTPQAFADWDDAVDSHKLTLRGDSSRINVFSHSVYAWLLGSTSGVPAACGSRAETLLLDLVRAGIENDFERVVFPQHPELRGLKRVLERAGARYASLSGSGSSVYGFFDSAAAAEKGVAKLAAVDVAATATRLLGRAEYWQQMFA